jgi:hypothetical protein
MAVFRMVTNFFWSPFDTPPTSNGDYNFLIAKRGAIINYYIEKTTLVIPFGRSKIFGHRMMVWVCQMAIKIHQLPSDD